MDIASLSAQEDHLIFSQFNEDTALELGLALVGLARANAHPVVIDIRTADRTLFHAAMPGSAPFNDIWARRKSNVTLAFQTASLLVGTRMREKGEDLAKHGFAGADYAIQGGSFPIRVQGVGVIAAVTVSGLSQAEDHAMVVQALESLL
ncbi:MAG: heme-degrading domain-containing protein [Erythrobacter sp.]|nr:heme-degrading domain-containing protein [Erythrobacter sp.]